MSLKDELLKIDPDDWEATISSNAVSISVGDSVRRMNNNTQYPFYVSTMRMAKNANEDNKGILIDMAMALESLIEMAEAEDVK